MPVQLGCLLTSSGSVSDPKKEKQVADFEYRLRWKVANSQLSAMRVYLYYVGKFFATQLIRSGEVFKGYDLANYVNSECQSLRLGEERAMRGVGHGPKKYISRPYPTLLVDLNKARRDKRGHSVSWIFQRLYELSESRVFVQVWDAAHTQKGVGAETKYESQVNLDEHFEKVDYIWIRVFYQDPLNPTAPLDQRGETYVHELIIHAWRHAFYGAINPAYRYMDPRKKGEARKAHLYYLYGHHRGGTAHVLDDASLPHSQADIEADLLWYYFMGREQLDPKTKRPRHGKGEFYRLIRSVGGDSFMCKKVCRLPAAIRLPGPQGH